MPGHLPSLVSTDWLAAQAGAKDLRIVDASYHLPDTGRDAGAEYRDGHIEGALFLDLASLVDPASPVDNAMPDAETVAVRMGGLGIAEGDRIVLYDDSAIHSATRAWFLLRLFGARQVAVLDGGLGKWKAEGRPVTRGEVAPAPVSFRSTPSPTRPTSSARLRSKADVLANIATGREELIDARGSGRFTGMEKESRPGLASGHIPGARNLHYARLYDADGGFRTPDELRAIFAEAGIDPARPVVTTCGSGMTACALAFALHLIGREDVALYDGSWSEWGSDPDTPKASGPA